ncbi:hypothetical protein [Streptomyces agglomeratus]|uniref:hypothetical protein n=1 Tax=Streptomyces agglomeratus TaxID=285458 RepID=UPI00114D0597|nr:hypothetical protein [Streptomyces agglomeratus]
MSELQIEQDRALLDLTATKLLMTSAVAVQGDGRRRYKDIRGYVEALRELHVWASRRCASWSAVPEAMPARARSARCWVTPHEPSRTQSSPRPTGGRCAGQPATTVAA